MSNHSLCATRATLVATAALLLAAAGSPVLAQCEFAKLLAADGTAGAAFGGNVAVAGDVAVIAAPGDDERGEDAGATYVLRFRAGAPGEWVPEAKLVAADGVAGDRFGSAVAITGDVILIGASGVDDGGSEAGAAYVFRYDAGGSGTWTEDAKLLPAEAGAGDQFGCAVALAPDVAVIGARGAGIGGSAAGAAFVFRYGGGAWQPEARLLATDAGAGDHFGATVAVSSSTALIGAADVDAAGTDSGAAYVFRCSGADWSQEAKLLPVDGAGGDHFAAAIALTDGVALIGAPGADANGANAGSGYVFRRDGAVWSQESRLVASDAAAGDEFGCAVSISGDVAALGARFKDGVGGVYAFRHAGGEWAEEAALSAAEGRVGAELGGSVA
ncbi:MAG: FG-GAP repeat protein, partial [Planctomycetes bacterium]|nr:FG-GAP repeat protein [Planctomycetota bacterium]